MEFSKRGRRGSKTESQYKKTKELYWCMILNFKGVLNYDLAFFDEIPDLVSRIRTNDTCTLSVTTTEEDKDQTTEAREVVTTDKAKEIKKTVTSVLPVYRFKLSDMAFKEDGGIGITNYYLTCWINTNGGVFKCRCDNIGTYDRIFGDLYDPVAGQWMSEWLLKECPDKFVKCRHSH